jgi:protein-S-isoprenylcysteine O-methyltransferase Ste14
VSDLFHSLTAGLVALPAYGLTALLVLLIYGLQSEIRFGSAARSATGGAADRGSTLAVSLASAVPVAGFVIAMKWPVPGTLPGMPAVAWLGAGLAALGVLIRLWSLIVLRERYTRTLLIHADHGIEQGGPYRFVRHPGYLGSLLCLNGFALASGNAFVLLASIAATVAAYTYRIRVEEDMLVAAFGAQYALYRSATRALVPFIRA